MSSPFAAPESSLPDLSQCERELIHLPGAIEPHGALLVVDEPKLTILQASSNTQLLLGISAEALLGKHLKDVLTHEDVERLTTGNLEEGKRSYVGGVRARNTEVPFEGLVHRNAGVLIIELEPYVSSIAIASSEIYAALTTAMADLDSPLPLTELCGHVATQVRHLTCFDRVMIYRFLDDDSGEVVAEDRREDMIPYLGLRYPASDIPVQARRLYLLNTLRLKPDVNSRRATLVPDLNPLTAKPLDMTYCILRTMSPVHVEYLRNMGVTASMSISIVKDGRLWGLIACHHGQPKFVPHPMRITCEVLARVFSSHIAAAEERDQRAHRVAVTDLADRIGRQLRKSNDVVGTLTQEAEGIMDGLCAEGAVFSIRGKRVLVGMTPTNEQLDELLVWLSVTQTEHLLMTERLAATYEPATQFADSASGLLSVRIALGSPNFILFFRPPVVQVIDWAGNPDKPVEETEAGKRISPRLSFQSYKQTVGDRSEPWDHTDREFSIDLRQIIAEALLIQSNEDVLRLNLELARSNIELDSFAYAASHDLQEPVRMIRSYAQLLSRRAGGDLPADSRDLLGVILSNATRMGELITALLGYSQLGGAERRERKPLNLEPVLAIVLLNLEGVMREAGATVTYDVLPVVNSDHNHMMQLLQNLIGNAIKYRQPNVPPRIHLAATSQGDHWQFAIGDNGEGFEPAQADFIFEAFKRLHGRDVAGSGIGLATCKRIVEQHAGRIWAESRGKGLGATFFFTLPV